MASKLAALAALFLAALFVAHAGTVEVTVEEPSENHVHRGRMGGSCREQFRMADELSHCQDMMMEMCGRRGRCRGMMGEGSRNMRQCCQQLRQMDEECRCEGLREMMMEQMMEMGSVGGREMEEMVRNLPSMCGMEPQMCEMGRMRRRNWA